MLVPFLVSALVGALASKFLLSCVKRSGPFIGLFLSWLFVSLLALCTPYPFLCVLLFGFLFMKVTNAKIWPHGILAMLLYWGLHLWLNAMMPEFLRAVQNNLQQWRHYVKTLATLPRGGGIN